MSAVRPTAVLGLDLGTTEIKAGIVDLDGRLLALTRSPYDLEIGALDGPAAIEAFAGRVEGIEGAAPDPV